MTAFENTVIVMLTIIALELFGLIMMVFLGRDLD